MIRNAEPGDTVEYQGFYWWIDRIIEPAFKRGKKVYVIKRAYRPVKEGKRKPSLKVHTSSALGKNLRRISTDEFNSRNVG